MAQRNRVVGKAASTGFQVVMGLACDGRSREHKRGREGAQKQVDLMVREKEVLSNGFYFLNYIGDS